MTIGIAVTGQGAGLAAFRALAAVERVARGAVGGFVSFVVITRTDTGAAELVRAETQRGGTTTLFTDGEKTGVVPPPLIAEARFAALMSSGPDRPAPLAQFTPGDAAVGLLTGHRLPNVPGDGASQPLNLAVLARLRAGATPKAAIEAELEAHPEADAGLIALDLQGRLHLADSAFVQARADRGSALLVQPGRGVAVLHNAIHPHAAIAPLAAAVAMDSMAPADRADLVVTLEAGLLLELGTVDALHLDDGDRVSRVTVTRPAWLGARRDGAVVNFATPVMRAGRTIGTTTDEPYCVVEAGRLCSMSGQTHVTIGVRRSD